ALRRWLTPPDAARLKRLVADLGDDDFQTREKAAKELERVDEAAAAPLRAALASSSAEVRRHAEALLGRLKPHEAGQLGAAGAGGALERSPPADARRLLKDLAARDGDTRLTREAKKALERFALAE